MQVVRKTTFLRNVDSWVQITVDMDGFNKLVVGRADSQKSLNNLFHLYPLRFVVGTLFRECYMLLLLYNRSHYVAGRLQIAL